MTRQEIAYKDYIDNHRSNVEKAWDLMRPHVQLNPEEYEKLNRLIKEHDASKYCEEEFDRYRQFFFPDEGEAKSMDLFMAGWNHHQKANPHHWQYWVMYKRDGRSKALEMPKEYVVEMICDWLAMSINFRSKPSDWFSSNREEMLLHPATLEYVNELMVHAETAYERETGDAC